MYSANKISLAPEKVALQDCQRTSRMSGISRGGKLSWEAGCEVRKTVSDYQKRISCQFLHRTRNRFNCKICDRNEINACAAYI